MEGRAGWGGGGGRDGRGGCNTVKNSSLFKFYKTAQVRKGGKGLCRLQDDDGK